MTRPVRGLRSHESWLAVLLTAAILAFSVVGTNFATWRNLVELARLAGEVGLLALALTPIIVTGGIDLSVGALMGLVAVVFAYNQSQENPEIPPVFPPDEIRIPIFSVPIW